VTHLIFPSGESKKGKGNETGERKKVLDYSLEYLHGITNGAWMLRKECKMLSCNVSWAIVIHGLDGVVDC
jgi:hypothetical protein